MPVFLADVKGDLSGIARPGQPNDRTAARAADIGQSWTATGFPVEFFSLGGPGNGVPVRATVTSFGPTLLSQGARPQRHPGVQPRAGLPLRRQAGPAAARPQGPARGLQYLTSDEGKADLKKLGGLSSATAGVILRELIGFADQGAEVFFGEPEFDTADLLRTAADGRGVVTCLELPAVQDKPALFSTFLMWLLADLFHDLPEVGDLDKPKLVFFFDEAHLLFDDASQGLPDADRSRPCG